MLFLIIGKLGKRPKTTFQIRIKTNSFKVLQEKKKYNECSFTQWIFSTFWTAVPVTLLCPSLHVVVLGNLTPIFPFLLT